MYHWLVLSTGECVISLKDMFDGELCHFEATMTHYGEETGRMKWVIALIQYFIFFLYILFLKQDIDLQL